MIMLQTTSQLHHANPPGWNISLHFPVDKSYRLLEKGSRKPLKKELAEVVVSDQYKGSRYILCATCGNRITKTSERVEIIGSHEHTFANPHGMIYHIGCFLNALGCIGCFEESTQFAWFQGYSWQIEICWNCGIHLGWIFNSEHNRFHGLILDRLVKEHESTKAS
tara:strand:+ start:595 stop:1089 length:495 start_codon:yes stop_codon:yes gene_type:complete